MRLRRVALRRATLRSLQEGAEGRLVKIKSKVLIAALMVGLCITLTPNAAVPLVLTERQAAQAQPKLYAKKLVMAQWGKRAEYKCLEQLVQHESGWRIQAHNKRSGAFGLFQFLPSTWGNYKFPYKPKEASIQITAGLRYITKRYGSPCKAWSFWQRNAKRGNPWY